MKNLHDFTNEQLNELKDALSIRNKALNDLQDKYNTNDVNAILEQLKDVVSVVNECDFALISNGVNSMDLGQLINCSENHMNELKRQGENGFIYNGDINYLAVARYYKKSLDNKKCDKLTLNQLIQCINNKVEYNEQTIIESGYELVNKDGLKLHVNEVLQDIKNFTIIGYIEKDEQQKPFTLGSTKFVELYCKIAGVKKVSLKLQPKQTSVDDLLTF